MSYPSAEPSTSYLPLVNDPSDSQATGNTSTLPLLLSAVQQPLHNYREGSILAGSVIRGSLSHATTARLSPSVDSSQPGSPLLKGTKRVQLTEMEKVYLVRMCVTHGEEFLGVKEAFWNKMTQMIVTATGKNIPDARGVVRYVYKNWLKETAMVSLELNTL